ncbi:hypothetical protein P047_01856, partial [Brucella abortus 99-9971-159]
MIGIIHAFDKGPRKRAFSVLMEFGGLSEDL